jgi:hypothetical protein
MRTKLSAPALAALLLAGTSTVVLAQAQVPLSGSAQWGYATLPTAATNVAYPQAYVAPPAPAYAAPGRGVTNPPGGQQYSGGITGNTQPDRGYPVR